MLYPCCFHTKALFRRDQRGLRRLLSALRKIDFGLNERQAGLVVGLLTVRSMQQSPPIQTDQLVLRQRVISYEEQRYMRMGVQKPNQTAMSPNQAISTLNRFTTRILGKFHKLVLRQTRRTSTAYRQCRRTPWVEAEGRSATYCKLASGARSCDAWLPKDCHSIGYRIGLGSLNTSARPCRSEEGDFPSMRARHVTQSLPSQRSVHHKFNDNNCKVSASGKAVDRGLPASNNRSSLPVLIPRCSRLLQLEPWHRWTRTNPCANSTRSWMCILPSSRP